MKRRVLAFVLAGLLLAGSYWGYNQYGANDDKALTASGTIEATRVELSAKVFGTLGPFSIKPGDTLKEGQLIGQLIRNDLVAQKERDALGVLKAETQLKDLTSGARQQELKDASAAVNIARAGYEKTRADFQRGEQLFKEGAIPQDQWERLSLDLTVKQNQLESAQAKLSLLEAGGRPDVIKGATTEVERSKAVLKASEALLADTKIFSPINGTVLTKNREPGEFVQAGASVATVADLNNMWIKVFVPTDDLPKVKLNQRVSFTVSGTTREYQGVIEEIATQGEYTPKTIQTKKERTNIVYAVKIRINNEGGTLKPGMPADVVFK